MDILLNIFENTKEWSNLNSGFVAIVIFIITILFGWFSGIFRALRLKPKLKIEVIEGPSICSTFNASDMPDTSHHRTAISIYMQISNIGSSPTAIDKISVGYKSKAYRNPFKWYWLENETVCLSEFLMPIGQQSKTIPFLRQKNRNSNNTSCYITAVS